MYEKDTSEHDKMQNTFEKIQTEDKLFGKSWMMKSTRHQTDEHTVSTRKVDRAPIWLKDTPPSMMPRPGPRPLNTPWRTPILRPLIAEFSSLDSLKSTIATQAIGSIAPVMRKERTNKKQGSTTRVRTGDLPLTKLVLYH